MSTAHILVVDDEPDIRNLVQEILIDEGYDVVYGSPTLMPDNKTIWLVCNGNSDGIARVATMTVGSPDVAYINDGWVDPKWEVEGIGFSRDFKYMGAQVNMSSLSERIMS